MSQKLITIDPSPAGSSLDARSAVRDTTNDERASFWKYFKYYFYNYSIVININILNNIKYKMLLFFTVQKQLFYQLPPPKLMCQVLKLYHPDEVNTSETEANALHVTRVMNKIAETSSKKGKESSSQIQVKTPKTSQITRSVSKKTDYFFKANSKKLSKIFKKLQVKDVQQTKGPNVNFNDDEDEVYNNPNLHSEEQDELEIPNDI
ncbi:unnamed protein product [Rhizophagus irregularis]|uniref:Uncharacterized protein n=1 Tax=Rhizophagus irregularis TaxID=588596 RepID=A0A915YXG8_9GLOM|nr:unnamed protein product [Rhizophagus irregularis]